MYKVQDADTCDSVTKEYDISKTELLKLNPDIVCTGDLPEGWTLCVLGWGDPEPTGAHM